MKKNVYRQGDVLIVSVDQIPSGLKQTKRVTLALGEVTGHHHTISHGAVGFADDEDGLAEYFNVTDDSANLTHQEHDTITIPRGTYRKVIQVEYTPGALVNVRD